MAHVTWTSREAYYRHCMSGHATTNRDRIVRYFLRVGRPATRHEACDRFFCIHGGYPQAHAQDGGRPIPWQSLSGSIAGMKCRTEGCGHQNCRMYLAVDHYGPDPVTGEPQVEFLVPITENWMQRRMFNFN